MLILMALALGEHKMTIKEMVKDKTVTFEYYKDNELWYCTEDGFEFPVPIEDIGNATFFATDKAILFMRYIRKHLETIAKFEKLKEEARIEGVLENL